jgi:hypothetical protein
VEIDGGNIVKNGYDDVILDCNVIVVGKQAGGMSHAKSGSQ